MDTQSVQKIAKHFPKGGQMTRDNIVMIENEKRVVTIGEPQGRREVQMFEKTKQVLTAGEDELKRAGQHPKMESHPWSSKRRKFEMQLREEKRYIFKREIHTKKSWQFMCNSVITPDTSYQTMLKLSKRISGVKMFNHSPVSGGKMV